MTEAQNQKEVPAAQAPQPALPVHAQQETFPAREKAALDPALLETLLRNFRDEAKRKGYAERYENADRKKEEDTLAKAKKDYEKKLLAGEAIEPTEKEKEALAIYKKDFKKSARYAGITAGLVAGLLLAAFPPAFVAAGAVMAFGLATSAAATLLGYLAGESLGEAFAKNMKPRVKDRDFSLTEEKANEIKKNAKEKAAIYAAQTLIQELWEDQRGKKEHATDKLETALEAMQRQLKLDETNKPPESALQVLENYRREIGSQLDVQHREKLNAEKEENVKNSPEAVLGRGRQILEKRRIRAAIDRLSGAASEEELARLEHLNRQLLTAISTSKDPSLKAIFGDLIAKSSLAKSPLDK